MRRLLSAALLGCSALLPVTTVAGPASMDPALYKKAKRAVDYGLRFLREQQAEDGSWSKSAGVTALGLRAFLESPRGYNEGDGPFITRPVSYLLYYQQPNGAIADGISNRNYTTAVAITALQATGNAEYRPVIESAQGFLAGLQLDEEDGYGPEHKYYGGIGYGGDERPDLSNEYMALEALHLTGLAKDDPVWEKAIAFVSRCQNRSESNDQEWAGNDGGFTYMPGYSPHGGAGSYGGMTSAGLLSLLYAGVDRQDPRVQAAYDWIREHYTLDDNPGAKNKQGLFYYYNAFAKAMAAYGEPIVVDAQGVEHNWRNELARKLLSLQHEEGYWVNEESGRWWEGDKNLVTAWSIIALNHVLRD
jgi:squalene-hopene/tetraprenyl-beta-curcumene cyclase